MITASLFLHLGAMVARLFLGLSKLNGQQGYLASPKIYELIISSRGSHRTARCHSPTFFNSTAQPRVGSRLAHSTCLVLFWRGKFRSTQTFFADPLSAPWLLLPQECLSLLEHRLLSIGTYVANTRRADKSGLSLVRQTELVRWPDVHNGYPTTWMTHGGV